MGLARREFRVGSVVNRCLFAFARRAGAIPAATHFLLAATAAQTSAVAFSITATAVDSINNVTTYYRGTTAFASTDGTDTVPANYTFALTDNGVHAFTNGITMLTAGSHTITFSDTASPSITQSITISIAAAAANHLVVTAPASVSSGAAFSVSVTAEDPANNTATSYRGTVAFTKSDSGGGSAVPANYTFQASDSGVHVFASGGTLVTVGSQTITATDTVTGSITGKATVSVIAVANHLVVSAPANATTGVAFDLTITAEDGPGNTATGYVGTITFASSDGGATLSANYTFVGGDAGQHVFTNGVTMATAGSQTVTATDTVTGTIKGSAAVTVASGVDLASGVRANWHMQEASGNALDSSGNANTFVDSGTVGRTTGPGTVPFSRTFNGLNLLAAVDSASLDLSGTSFTIGLWVKLPDNTVGVSGILAKWQAGGPIAGEDYAIYYNSESSGLFDFYTNNSTNSTLYLVQATTFGTPANNQWCLLLCDYDIDTHLIGISVNNGTRDTLAGPTGGISEGAQPLTAGTDGLGNFLACNIGPTMIWGRLLNTAEKAAFYNGGNGVLV